MHVPPGKLPLVPWGCIEAPDGASKLFKKCIGPFGPKFPGPVRGRGCLSFITLAEPPGDPGFFFFKKEERKGGGC